MYGIPFKYILNLLAATYDDHWLPENQSHKKPLLCRVLDEHV